jgi:Flp pilus assembly protein TadD
VDLANDLAVAHNCLGIVSDGTGAYQQAADEFQRAVALDPSSDDALLGLAYADDKLGKPGEAEGYFKRAIALHPQYWEGYARLGTFYFAAARYREAEEQFQRLTMLVPEGEIGYSNLGAAYLAEGRYPEAVSQFQRAIELQPSAVAYSNLGSTLLFQHRFDEAARAYETAVRQKDAEYWQWGNLAEAYALLPTESAQVKPVYLKASEAVNEALRVNPRDEEAIHYASLYQAMLGHKEASLALLHRIQEDSRIDPELRSTDAKIYYRLGMTDRALSELEKAVSSGYSRAWVRDDPAFAGMASSLQFQKIVQ